MTETLSQVLIELGHDLPLVILALVMHEYGHFIGTKIFNINSKLNLLKCQVTIYKSPWKVFKKNNKWVLYNFNKASPQQMFIIVSLGIIAGVIPILFTIDTMPFMIAYTGGCIFDFILITNIMLIKFNIQKPSKYIMFERIIRLIGHGKKCICKDCFAIRILNKV